MQSGRERAGIRRESVDRTEAPLFDFDPNDDLESVVPMPPSIPRALRRVLTRAFVRRFEFYDELDEWLHDGHPALNGETPFERLIQGDGWGVLRALGGARHHSSRVRDYRLGGLGGSRRVG